MPTRESPAEAVGYWPRVGIRSTSLETLDALAERGEGDGDCEGDLQAWLRDVIRKTTDLSGRFGKAAEELIAAAMKRLGAGALKFKDQ